MASSGKEAKPQSLKFPYPVLNDKRDLKTILNILSEKEKEMTKKMNQTKSSYKKTTEKKRKEKLKILYKNIKSQLEKIEKQIEFVKINIKIKKIEKLRDEKNDIEYKKEQYDELNGQVSRLAFFMKEANHSFLNENKLQQQKKAVESEVTTTTTKSSDTSMTMQTDDVVIVGGGGVVPTVQPQPMNYYQQQQTTMMPGYNQWPATQYPVQQQQQYKPQPYYQQQQQPTPVVVQKPKQPLVNENFIIDPVKRAEYIQTSLAIAIAQTAAAAHAHAAISAIAINPPPPPPTDGSSSVVLTKSEVDKASLTFENFKNKINFLLEADKKSTAKKPTNSLKTLISAYKDDEEEEEEETVEMSGVENHTVLDNDEGEYSSDDSDTEVDIILLSNAKNYNFVVPSKKACGLKSSIRNMTNDEYALIDSQLLSSEQPVTKPSLLIAQRSAYSVTFMGSSSILTKNSSLKNILFNRFNKIK